ncbi:Uncharacterised protein [Mycobacteroides abscessus subsp. abscessus]|nr:Uncharacterised protein [Mycobacteroides abscessus subsp. abscessus]
MISRSQVAPLEMKVFAPVMAYSSPSRTARVLMACRSDPVPGSVMAMAPIHSPETSLGIHRFFCSSFAYESR